MENLKKLSKQYDRLYGLADKLFKKYNPCQIKDGNCIMNSNCCCQGCEYLGKSGCTVKALACKLHICGAYVWRDGSNEKLIKRLFRLQRIAKELDIWFVRSSKEETFNFLKQNIKIYYK